VGLLVDSKRTNHAAPSALFQSPVSTMSERMF
jgi:hypothetical protein